MNKKIVVIGGGFAGSMVARKLVNKCDVTLIDTEDFFEYTPGILRVLVEPEKYHKLHARHTDYLSNARVIVSHVKSIGNKNVVLANGKKVVYDYLVIASGSNYATPIKEENTFFANRIKNLLEANKKIKKAKKIFIVGGGIVGVELTAEIATHHKDKTISLIHSHSRLMERNNPKSSEYAQKFLEKQGVKIIFNEKILKKEGKNLIGASGSKYPYDAVFFTVGITPNTDFMTGSLSKLVSKGIIVNEFLQLIDNSNIFVAGDVSNISEEKTAQNAEMHGKVVAKNILALIHGKPLKQYKSRKRVMVISLGKHSGIIECKRIVISGFLASLAKCFIEKKVMWGFR